MCSRTIGRPMEILLIEDSLVDARLTMGVLKKGSVPHRLTLVMDGEEAMEFMHKQGRFARAPTPDLVLLDLELPKKDGRQVLQEIRGDGVLRDLPVVVLTASEAHEDHLRCEQLQVEGYLTKPFDPACFLAVVHELKRFWHADLILPTLEQGAS